MKKEKYDIVGDYKYGFKTKTDAVFKTKKGLNKEVIETISKEKNEPKWMRDFRMKSYEEFLVHKYPSFGPNLEFIFII